MGDIRKWLALIVFSGSAAQASFVWSGADLNTYSGFDVHSGLGVPTKYATFGVESGFAATFNQVSILTSSKIDSQTLLADRSLLDGAEVRVGIVAREIKIPSRTSVSGYAPFQAYVGVGAAYQFKRLYGVYDDLQSGKLNLGGLDPQTPEGMKAIRQIAQNRVTSDLNPYFEGGVMGKLAGPLGWRLGMKVSDGFSINGGLELRLGR